MPEKLLVLGAGPFQIPAILKGKEMGYTVVATDVNPMAVGLQEADHPHTVDLIDISGCLALAKQYQVSGVLTVASEPAVPTVAAVAEAMGLPGPSVRGAAISNNKALMRGLFADCGIPSAQSKLCRSLDDVDKAAGELSLPVVIKPIDNAGSRGVMYVDAGSELPRAFQHAMDHSREKQVVVEEYMPGVELSVEGFVWGGHFAQLALSDKRRTPSPYLMDTTVLFPSVQPEKLQETVCAMVKAAVESAGVENATIHAEVMVTEDGPKMVEFAARGAGFKVFTDMLPWVTGIDVVQELIKLSVGQKPSLEPLFNRGAVLRFPEAPPGMVLEVSGLEEAKSIPGLAEMELYVERGDEVKPLTSGSDRVGYIITFGESREDAELAMEKVEEVVCITVAQSNGHTIQ